MRDTARLGRVSRGQVRQGMVCIGSARFCEDSLSKARQGQARKGALRLGEQRLGMVRFVEARSGGRMLILGILSLIIFI